MKQTCSLTFFPLRSVVVKLLSAQLISFFKVAATHEAADGFFQSPPTVTLSEPKAASSKPDEDLYHANSHGLPISSS